MAIVKQNLNTWYRADNRIGFISNAWDLWKEWSENGEEEDKEKGNEATLLAITWT